MEKRSILFTVLLMLIVSIFIFTNQPQPHVLEPLTTEYPVPTPTITGLDRSHDNYVLQGTTPLILQGTTTPAEVTFSDMYVTDESGQRHEMRINGGNDHTVLRFGPQEFHWDTDYLQPGRYTLHYTLNNQFDSSTTTYPLILQAPESASSSQGSKGGKQGGPSAQSTCTCNSMDVKSTGSVDGTEDFKFPKEWTCPKPKGDQKALGPAYKLFYLLPNLIERFYLGYCFENHAEVTYTGGLMQGGEPVPPAEDWMNQCKEKQEIQSTIFTKYHGDEEEEVLCSGYGSKEDEEQGKSGWYPPNQNNNAKHPKTWCWNGEGFHPDDYKEPKKILDETLQKVSKKEYVSTGSHTAVIHWIDNPLDMWDLEQYVAGKLKTIESMYRINKFKTTVENCECTFNVITSIIIRNDPDNPLANYVEGHIERLSDKECKVN